MKTTGRKTIKATASAPKSVKAASAGSASRSPSVEEIARRSYELYMARGAAAGHEVQDWLQAEAELRAK